MTERQGLVRKAEKFLASAELLMDSGDMDSAVSRIYYAAFYIAEALLDALELSFSSHKSVISAFDQPDR
ncbi:MAG: HEPN domain-containing protein [Nitrospirae bacterium]|nr:HEPN domain-containing protein [Nitrospirota bacterium]